MDKRREKRLSRRRRVRARQRLARGLENQANQAYNRRRAWEHRLQRAGERQTLLDGMTNWQRTRWHRAGRPPQLDALRHFAALPHPKAVRALLTVEAQLEAIAGEFPS